ncbi:hypothetical protein TKK_0002062 [Trichogramma kaykai]|uniref:BCL2-associated athanogene 6 n=1 Tax=Trichogramma kaykai TaxID=54128 RepID=A0ABD2X8L4_9HYME
MLKLTVKTLDGRDHEFTCEDDITVQAFKEKIADTVNVTADSQRLIYCGRVLQDDKKLNDYDVNGKVMHLVQRPPPDASRSSNTDNQRQNNDSPNVQVHYRGRIPSNTMFLGAMSVPAEIVENHGNHGIRFPQLSSTLSSSRLESAKRMLTKANQLINRLDDPSLSLNGSPIENNASSNSQDSNENVPPENSENSSVPEPTESTTNVRDHENNQSSPMETSQTEQNFELPTPKTETKKRPRQDTPCDNHPESSSETPISDTNRPQASTSNNRPSTSRRTAPSVPRPNEMADLLDTLLTTQDRLRPYIERYRTLMSTDPVLTRESGTDGVEDNQRVIDGVSESLHYVSHACHALSDIIVDLGQQPPRNLQCWPIIVSHSTIVQAGLPIHVEVNSQLNFGSSRSNATSSNTNNTDEGNEATRPSSPSPEESRASSTNNRTSNQNATQSTSHSISQNAAQSLLGTLLHLPGNVEVSMELGSNSMDMNSSHSADGAETEQGQNNNTNGSIYSMTPPFAMLREAIQSVLGEGNVQLEATGSNSGGGGSINIAGLSGSIPFVTIVGANVDNATSNPGQSTQARSNIGTHPTTSTQTRSTARPHVLHSHTHPFGHLAMDPSLEFDPMLSCNSHHVRRPNSNNSNSNSNSTSQTAQPTTSQAPPTRRFESRAFAHSASEVPTSQQSQRRPATRTTLDFSTMQRNIFRDVVQNIFNVNQPVPDNVSELTEALCELFNLNRNQAHMSIGSSGDIQIGQNQYSNVSLIDLLGGLPVDEYARRNFFYNLWVFLFRNMTVLGLLQIRVGNYESLINLRRGLRTFIENSFPGLSTVDLQDHVVDHIITQTRTYLQVLNISQPNTSQMVDIPATIEALLHKFYREFLTTLFNNDLDDTSFARSTISLIKKLEDQFVAVFQFILSAGPALERLSHPFVNGLLSDRLDNQSQSLVVAMLHKLIQDYSTRTSKMPVSEVEALIVYNPVVQDDESKDCDDEEMKEFENKPETLTMELDPKIPNDPMDLANGQDIPVLTAPEDIPTEWISVIARDNVRQRRASQMNQMQGGNVPFSDAYLNCLPSKRRKLIEQQKPQLLVPPTPPNSNNAIAASVERLVRDGITQTRVGEIEGAAKAVGSTSTARNAFGQAIKDCLNQTRFKTSDFPDAKRFPNATRFFGNDAKSGESSKSNK